MERYRTVTALQPDQIDELMALYESVWWAQGRRRADVETMLASTDLVVGVVDDVGRLAAFARVLTDHTYIALLLDVIVAENRRGQSLGRALMDAVLSQPALAKVHSIELVCQPDLVAFYERWGLTTDVGRSTLMRRTTDTALGP